MTEPDVSSRRNSRRRSREGSVPAKAARTARYRHLENPFPPLRVFSDDQVASLHAAALTLLEREGMKVLSERARAVLRFAGAQVDHSTAIVRLDRGLVATALATAPSSVALVARNPERSCEIGGRSVVFAPVAGPPNVSDAIRGRRSGDLAAFSDLVRLAQVFDVIHVLAQSVEPLDTPLAERHLATTHAQLTLSDKVPFIYCRGTAQIADCLEMIRLAHGVDESGFSEHARCYTVCNTNSPLQLDVPMAEGILDFAAAGQLVIITPFTLAGAMAPVTLAGALTLAHAEALFGITLAQLARPGAPVLYGSFTSNVDMRSGSPAFGTPEYAKAALGAGQLARHIGLPWRCSNANASNTPDAQSMGEASVSTFGALLGGCNFLLHAAGWLEGGLTASFEKFILDIELLQVLAEMFRPVGATAEDIALEAVHEVGPGGHFFGAAHTLARYRDAFYEPLVADWRNYGTWSADGARTATERATGLWQSTLASAEAPAIEPAVASALDEFVARRRAEGGALPLA